MKRLISRLRHWILRRLIGKEAVIANCTIDMNANAARRISAKRPAFLYNVEVLQEKTVEFEAPDEEMGPDTAIKVS